MLAHLNTRNYKLSFLHMQSWLMLLTSSFYHHLPNMDTPTIISVCSSLATLRQRLPPLLTQRLLTHLEPELTQMSARSLAMLMHR